jgi:hypothetical protein
MSLRWEQVLPQLDGCEAQARLKTGGTGHRTVEGRLSLAEKEYVLFILEKDPDQPLPERAHAEFTVVAAQGIYRGDGVMVRRSPRQLQVLAAGNVEVVQRREHFRFRVDLPVILINPDGDEAPAVLADISISGGRVAATADRKKGELVQVRLEGTPVGTLLLTGIVRVSEEEGGAHCLGLEWSLYPDVWEQLKSLLLSILARRWPKDPAPAHAAQRAAANRESVLQQAETAAEHMTRIVELLLQGQQDPQETHEVLRLSREVIDAMALIAETLRDKPGETAKPDRRTRPDAGGSRRDV